jgi:two-component system alkaline phosphatase synthesis response regulator PhoP
LTNLMLIAQESETAYRLQAGLVQNGFACPVISYGDRITELVGDRSPDLLLMEMDGCRNISEIMELAQTIKQAKPLPIVALVPSEQLANLNGQLNTDDFLTSPYDMRELVLRIKRLLRRNGNGDNEEIRCGGLVIDSTQCEVTLEGKLVELTFKEYQLLRFLAGNRGRVFTRQALLNRVWGYDYYGGERTVDVHVRRLRSKIEDSKHVFIETVRNIGYRFKKNVSSSL